MTIDHSVASTLQNGAARCKQGSRQHRYACNRTYWKPCTQLYCIDYIRQTTSDRPSQHSVLFKPHEHTSSGCISCGPEHVSGCHVMYAVIVNTNTWLWAHAVCCCSLCCACGCNAGSARLVYMRRCDVAGASAVGHKHAHKPVLCTSQSPGLRCACCMTDAGSCYTRGRVWWSCW